MCVLPFLTHVPIQIPLIRGFYCLWRGAQRQPSWSNGSSLLQHVLIKIDVVITENVDIDPIRRPSFTPWRTFPIAHSPTTRELYGRTDDTYIHILSKGLLGAMVNIVSTPMDGGTSKRIAGWHPTLR